MAQHEPPHHPLPPRYSDAGAERNRGHSGSGLAAEGSGDLLRAALAREADLRRQKDALLEQHEVLRREADHRLMNGLQMVVSLLSLQSRAAATPAIAQQLTSAAHRVAAIERVHRRLHDLDGRRAVAFKPYLEDLCRDVAGVIGAEDQPERSVCVESIELNLPAVTAIPLGFIANELITNAAKHGDGPIRLYLEQAASGAYRMSVSNDGPCLPAAFDPAASKGLGMKIVQSFARQIDGVLSFQQGAGGQGACFSIDFSLAPFVREARPDSTPSHQPGAEQDERLRRERAARALCRRAGYNEDAPFKGRPTWTWYLDYVYIVLRCLDDVAAKAPPSHCEATQAQRPISQYSRSAAFRRSRGGSNRDADTEKPPRSRAVAFCCRDQ